MIHKNQSAIVSVARIMFAQQKDYRSLRIDYLHTVQKVIIWIWNGDNDHSSLSHSQHVKAISQRK